MRQGAPRTAEELLILAATRAEADELNRCAQEARHEALGENALRLSEHYLYEGDRVRFTRNDYARNIENGALGTVEEIKDNTITVRLDDGRAVATEPEHSDLTLGYASTTHAAQGMTVERSFVLLGGSMQDRSLTYVQASRAREETHFYIDRESAGPYLRDLLRAVEKENVKELAREKELEHPPHALVIDHSLALRR